MSHLYGLFHANQISAYRTPELFSAACTTLLHRGDVSPAVAIQLLPALPDVWQAGSIGGLRAMGGGGGEYGMEWRKTDKGCHQMK